MKNFALVGVAGFIAPRHLKAIKETGNVLVAAVDKSDSVGILDSYFPKAAFFTEFERFDRHVEKLKRLGAERAVRYVSICSPNYLHDAHVRFALRAGAHAVCEKPLVLNPWNVDALKEIEAETGGRIYTVLQLRLHPSIEELRRHVAAAPRGTLHDIELTYIASRGTWYTYSWKGDVQKSGGVGTNIGIHFFDMLLWIFGDVKHSEVHISTTNAMAGYLELERARVRWFLSVDADHLPNACITMGAPTYRAVSVDGCEVEFSRGFGDLHTSVYREILAGGGFGLEDARDSINLAHRLRHAKPVAADKDRFHPLAGRLLE